MSTTPCELQTILVLKIILTTSDSHSDSGRWLCSCARATAAVAAAGYWSSKLRAGAGEL